ncbi:MAG: choice-of-anchor K domain-containing protein [Microbacterium sp.]
MQYHDALPRAPFILRRAAAITTAATVAIIAIAASIVVASPASAATVTVPGGITAEMIGHSGYEQGVAAPDAGDCPRYGSAAAAVTTGPIGNPGGDAGTVAAGFTDGRTGAVAPGSIAYSAHGSTSGDGCGAPQLDLSTQSAVGFEPAAVTAIETGTTFNVGRMVHRNNPLRTLVNDWFRGTMQVNLLGLELPYEWMLNETPNNASPASNPANNDVLEFTGTVGDQSFEGPDGERYTLVVSGFTTPLADGSCAPTLADPGAAINRFETVEQTSTYGCLYAEIQRVRSLTIVKTMDAASTAIPSFSFTSTSDAAGSPWAAGFALTPTAVGAAGAASVTHDVVESETISISEDQAAAPWRFTSLECVDGVGDALPITTGASLALSGAIDAADPIVCTYTNTDATVVEPVGSLEIAKTVTPREGTDPQGYTGGAARIFAVDYACTLDGIPAASGSVNVSTSAPALVDGLPAAAVCAVTGESQATVDGDFADGAFAWDGFEAGAPVAIVAGETARITVDNRFVQESGGEPTAPTDPGTTQPPSELPLTDGPTDLALTGAGPVLPVLGIAAILLTTGVIAFAVRGLRRRSE